METGCVYCEVQTENVYRMFVRYVLQGAKAFEKNSVILKKKKTKGKLFTTLALEMDI